MEIFERAMLRSQDSSDLSSLLSQHLSRGGDLEFPFNGNQLYIELFITVDPYGKMLQYSELSQKVSVLSSPHVSLYKGIHLDMQSD